MDGQVAYLILCLVAGLAASLAGGAASGLYVGREALGAELATYMGSLFGLLAGAGAVLLGLILHFVI